MLVERGTSKFTSAAPGSNRSKVTDLTAQQMAVGARFHWSYRNEGDFDQDGIVDISDLAAMLINYGKDSYLAGLGHGARGGRQREREGGHSGPRVHRRELPQPRDG